MAMVIPGTLRSASPKVLVACCLMVSPVTTDTACGVSCRLEDGMAATGGAFLSTFLSALSWTVTGPSCTGWAPAGAAMMSVAITLREAPESAKDLRLADIKVSPFKVQHLVSLTWLASLLAFGRKGLAWYAAKTARPYSLGED